MFERLSVRAHNALSPDAPLDLGALVEGLLFYGNTEVVLNPASIKQIAKFWSPEGLLELLDSGFATFKYQQDIAGIQARHSGTGRERYEPIVAEISQSASVPAGPELLISRVLEEVIGRRGRARRVTAQVCRAIKVQRFDADFPVRVTTDLLDSEFVTRAIRTLLEWYAPDFPVPPAMRFEVQQVADGLRVLTNIDFALANQLCRRQMGELQYSITPAFLLSHFLAARELVEEAARSGSDMAVDPVFATIAAVKIQRVLERRSVHQASIERFQGFVFEDARAVREAVNAGTVRLPEVLKLLERADRFRNWLREQPTDADLVKEYFRAATATTWVDKLPSKTVRWLLFSELGIGIDALGAGGVGTAFGVAAGAVDSLLLDRLLRGWKPNAFVESSLRPFVKKRPSSQSKSA